MPKEHAKVAELRSEDGGWLSPNKVGSDLWSDGALDNLNEGLNHLDPIQVEPRAVVLTLGIDYPLSSPVFRILGVTPRGVWIDSGKGRFAPEAVMIPWPAIFAITVHSETSESPRG